MVILGEGVKTNISQRWYEGGKFESWFKLFKLIYPLDQSFQSKTKVFKEYIVNTSDS